VVDGLGAATTWQVAEHLTWSRPWAEVGSMRFGAVAETSAHIAYLETQGSVATTDASDAGGSARLVRRSRA
jgi:hypothetical protein